MEIIDSRYAAFKFNLQDVVADNASSSGFVIGPIIAGMFLSVWTMFGEQQEEAKEIEDGSPSASPGR